MSTIENLKYNFIKPLISGVVGGFMTKHEYGNTRFQINTGTPLDRQISTMTFGAILGVSSSFLVESLSNITNAIDKKHKTKHLASFLTHSVGGMAAWALIAKALNPAEISNQEMMSLGKIGLISEIFSQWFHENFIEEDSFGSDVLDLL